MTSLGVLTQSEIAEIQRNFYEQAAQDELAPAVPYEYNGIKFPNLNADTVGPSTKFRVLDFANEVQKKVIEKLVAEGHLQKNNRYYV